VPDPTRARIISAVANLLPCSKKKHAMLFCDVTNKPPTCLIETIFAKRSHSKKLQKDISEESGLFHIRIIDKIAD